MDITEDSAKKLAAELGFSYFAALPEADSLLCALRDPENPLKTYCGVYLHVLRTGEIYVGKAVDLVRRQLQHASTGSRPDWLAFLPTAPEELIRVERAIIRKAAQMELPLVNRMLYNEQLPAPTTIFDDCFPAALQDAFIAEHSAHGTTRKEKIAKLCAAASPVERLAWEHFLTHPQAENMISAAGEFIHAVIPRPKDFEGVWWRLSLRSKEQRNAVRSWLSITCGLTKVLEFKDAPKASGKIDGIVCEAAMAGNLVGKGIEAGTNLRKVFRKARWKLPECEEPSPEALAKLNPVFGRRYASDEARAEDIKRQVTLAALYKPVRVTCTIAELRRLIADPTAIEAMQVEAIARMRRRAGLQAALHHSLAAYAALSAHG